jgi:cobalamin-dependent methionine synthase I
VTLFAAARAHASHTHTHYTRMSHSSITSTYFHHSRAQAVAVKQVADGAQIIDINMDDGLLDGVTAMTKFLNLCMTEPDVAKVPIMVDSSKFGEYS